MQPTEHYVDTRVRFDYPKEYKLKATASSGQYYLRRSKHNVLSMSVLPRELVVSAFESMISSPVPGTDRRKTVHDRYALGSKQGRAIAWEFLGAGASVIETALVFLFEDRGWGVLAELYARPPAAINELEAVLTSLEISPGGARAV
jgi:hypothetical protein